MAIVIPAHGGIPDLNVLVTADESEAAEFIKGWAGTYYHFGMDLEWKPTFAKGQYSRAATLQVCAGPWVLVFDLRAVRKARPQPLPDRLWTFLENEDHCFYGMGLLEDVSRLAFEFDCLVSGIDFAQRKAWPELMDSAGKGGLAAVANRVLGTCVTQDKKITMSNWEIRPLSARQLEYMAEDAYLSWALAKHFIKAEFPQEHWLISMPEMYGSCRNRFGYPGIIDISDSCHDWSAAKAEADRREAEKKARAPQKKLRRSP